ncbi:MAG: rRNA methyltransferase [Flavobacteriales bacterium]|nr:rRNA methyltransferase [Flavobacteriales bacterium]
MNQYTNNLVEHLKEFVLEERYKLFEKKIQERTQHITIVLENIFQARNISASIRSADCFGIQDVHIIENDNVFNNDTEVSMGAEKWITTKRYNQDRNNSVHAINHLKEQGYQIIATTPHNTDSNLYDLDITKQKSAIIFGSEINGCSEQTLNLADKRMKIPMYGFTESFNISVSVSLCLQHLTYKIRQSDINWKITKQQQQAIILQWLRNSVKLSTKIEKDFLSKINTK